MIIKKREKSILISKYEALLRRLPKEHSKRSLIEKDYQMQLAGYKGEKSVDYPLSFLDDKNYYIFQDLRLFDGKRHFQMDTLILSSNMFAIAEIKNYTGLLTFDAAFDQLIRTSNGEEEALPNPIIQVKRQIGQFEKWLVLNKFEKTPIEPLVIIANDRAVLKMNKYNQEIYRMVSTLSNFPNKISQLEIQHTQSLFGKNELRKLSRRLLKLHEPLERDILSLYGLSKDEIVNGVFCEFCKASPMERIHGNWICSHCGNMSRDAHVSALKDYGLLFGPVITNKSAREFLLVSSRYVIRRLFMLLNYNQEFQKNRLYYTLEFHE